ncbi:Bile salt export pump [Venustampulla echinocandica]|uniref:Bile salt export pump n=1 Tax=Venustampulla echinocandica TaxID=2656787 RepID=A0A370TAZ4_9HELO|nr:Bile salt export pump [Venustampulla echinocandica]RDL31099.1 Bile salt export pump [Venustampulla echinocandica]
MTPLSNESPPGLENSFLSIPITSNNPSQNTYELKSLESTKCDTGDQVSWRSLFGFTQRHHTLSAVFAIASSVAAGVPQPLAAIFYGRIFFALTSYGGGNSSSQETLKSISLWCIALTALGVAAWVLQGASLSSWMVFGELQAQSVRNQMFEGMLDKDIGWYDLRKEGIGSLLIRIQTQIRELQLAVSQPLGFLFTEVSGCCVAMGIAFSYSWKLTLVIFATVPVATVVLYWASANLGPAIEAQKRELTRASKYTNTAITAVNVVKAFNGQEQEVWQYHSTLQDVAAKYLIQARANALQFGITKFLTMAIFVQGFWYGLVLVRKGTDPGHILTTFYACLFVIQAVETVLPQWLVLTKGMSAGQTLKSIMDQMQNSRRDFKIAGCIKPEACAGDIEITDVTFAYPSNPQQQALSGAYFFFPAGETTFMVGKSGCGKSTLGNILMRYYEPSQGEIMVDGHLIETLDIEWLRRNITLVQQETLLFNETIFQNIALGKRDGSTREDIMKASETADLEQTIIKLPQGLDTIVGSNGKSLSGGQQQKVAIARSRLRDSPILILDEATSALDYASRDKVMKELRKWREGKTTIIITHDTTQILDDDYVYVMEGGIVVQEGYRRKLARDLRGPFSSFILTEQTLTAAVDDKIPPSPKMRRHSEPPAPIIVVHGDPDEEQHNYRHHISQLFGMTERTPTAFLASPNLRGTGQFSFGAGTTQAILLREDEFWSRPVVIDTPAFQQRQYSFTAAGLPKIEAPKYDLPAFDTPIQHHGGRTIKDLPTTISSRVEGREGEKQGGPASLFRIFGTIWPTLVWKHRLILIVGFFAAFVVAVCTPGFAFSFAKLLSTFYLTVNQSAEAKKWALILLGVAIVDGLAAFTTHYALEHCGQIWVNVLRVEALKRILAQPKSWFDKPGNSASWLNECLDRNAEEMRNLIGRFAGAVFTVFWMLGISVVWSLLLSWKLTLVALACAPVMVVVTRVFHWISSIWEEKCNQATEMTSSTFTETFSNIRVVRALTLEHHFRRKHHQGAAHICKTGLSRAIYSGLLYGLTDGVSIFVTALVFYYGAVTITNGEQTVARVIQVVNLLLFSIANANAMISIVPQINSSRTTATHMLYLANLPYGRSHESCGTKRILTPFPVQFNNLSFTYPNRSSVEALSKVSFTIAAGSCTAIVGPSGSGKSTIASLLLALYPPDPAQPNEYPPLTIAGKPISDCNIASLRGYISIVPQTALLFPTTILSNITYGLPEGFPFSNLEAAMEAAAEAGIHDFIMGLEQGYRTLIGEGGMGISGGQAQRICIARALVRRPKLLILDEATSALDAVNAEAIRETIRRMVDRGRKRKGGGMAVLVISHSMEMMRVAEEVVVIENGRLVEKGPIKELASRAGAFSRLVGVEGLGRDRDVKKMRFGSFGEGFGTNKEMKGPVSPAVGEKRNTG